MRRRFFIVFNRTAGVPKPTFLSGVIALLTRAGAVLTWSTAADGDGARAQAEAAVRAGAVDAVVAAGGDGTVRQVLPALAGTATPLGLIPLGTGNVLAHELGLARTPEAVAKALLEGATDRVRCARANGELFLLMAGAGFDGRIVGALDQRLKVRLGQMAYAGPIVGALARPLDALDVIVDGEATTASWVVICNARHYGGRFLLAPRTTMAASGLDVVLFRSRNRRRLVGQLLALARGRLHRGREDIEVRHGHRVTVTSAPPVPVQIDGDSFGATPLNIEADVAFVSLIGLPRPSSGSR